ncbi:hypothetical protein CN878_22425 [Ochrobactrum sp. 695/2009]|nr:hypothetical protein CN881_07795 [Ochrobactrum sp. 721/2009]PJT15728.1 hypothetical protein CN880_12170 [Ochrobactrum sp. 720/2009]PJT23910.1 hypothetical protein CN879_08760 [Ochrobactrum sp. 715/2009]PJT24054.1 hypothetical protein CN878_22425 [Ochrobactrum sp. 695/2009]PJT33585.1 hypothetical protein CN877_14100 [Ochrobactrum sp. 689/2009]
MPANRGPRAAGSVGWFRQGKKVAKAVAGTRSKGHLSALVFGQTSHIEDAGGRGFCRNRNEDRRTIVDVMSS